MMTDAEVRAIVKEAVRETMISYGFNPDDHVGNQKDQAFVRSWRENSAVVKKQGLITIVTAIGVVLVGFLGLVWTIFSKGSP